MKKAIYLFILFAASYSGSNAQIFPMYEEYSIPPTADVTRANNTYTYKKDKVDLEGSLHTLYLSCWSGGGGAGIFWRKGYSGETYLLPEVETASGYVQITPSGVGPYDFELVQDLSAVPLRVNNEGRIQVIATFYGARKVGTSYIYGHYMNVYEWAPTSTGGLTYVTTITLSTATTYGRISLDNYRMQAAVVTWSEGSILKTKLINFLPGGVDPRPTHTITGFNGYLPDVAIQARPPGSGSLTTVYYLFLDAATYYPYVVKTDMNSLFSSSAAFTLVDVNPDPFPLSWTIGGWISAYPTIPGDLHYHPGDNLQLSCPEVSANDSWAYLYTNDLHHIRLRRSYAPLYPVTTIPVTSGDLVGPGVFNQQLTIWVNNVYDVFTGWRSNVLSAGTNVWTYVGKMFNLSTGPASDYSVISNEDLAVSSISFQGQDNEAGFSDFYCSYVYFGLPVEDCEIDEEEGIDCIDWGYFLMYKFKPFTPMDQFHAMSPLPAVPEFQLYPNPVKEKVQLRYSGSYAQNFKVEVYNMEGKVISSCQGNVSDIERQLQSSLHSMVNGNYLLSFFNLENQEQQTLRLVKE